MTALFAVLLAISVYVPVLSLVSTLFLALPIAWYSAKYPAKASALVAVVGVVLSFLIGGLLSLPLALIHIPLGLMIGLSIHYKKSKLFMFMGSSIVLLLSLMLQYVAAIAFLGINFLEEFTTRMRSSYAQAGTWLAPHQPLIDAMGLSAEVARITAAPTAKPSPPAERRSLPN